MLVFNNKYFVSLMSSRQLTYISTCSFTVSTIGGAILSCLDYTEVRLLYDAPHLIT